jgi:hypothetical protein
MVVARESAIYFTLPGTLLRATGFGGNAILLISKGDLGQYSDWSPQLMNFRDDLDPIHCRVRLCEDFYGNSNSNITSSHLSIWNLPHRPRLQDLALAALAQLLVQPATCRRRRNLNATLHFDLCGQGGATPTRAASAESRWGVGKASRLRRNEGVKEEARRLNRISNQVERARAISSDDTISDGTRA